MKIVNPASNYINQTYANAPGNAANQTLKSQKPADSSASEPVDSINFSSQTKALQKISKAMDIAPVDRGKYVADIKQKIETNQYTVNAEKIAETILGLNMNQFG